MKQIDKSLFVSNKTNINNDFHLLWALWDLMKSIFPIIAFWLKKTKIIINFWRIFRLTASETLNIYYLFGFIELNAIIRKILFIRSHRAHNKWKIVIDVGFIRYEEWFVDLFRTKKTLSESLSLVKNSARLVESWWRYLIFLSPVYLWATLYISGKEKKKMWFIAFLT